MTDQQLYFAIGVPIVVNTVALLVVFGALNKRIDDLRSEINQRFDDMRDLWRAELRRVEEVLDARLKHV